MINAKIIISEIHYGKSFENLFPMALQKCREIENPNLAIRFLLKMGDASMTAALGILDLLDEKNKGALLCSLVNMYSGEILSALNLYLEKNEFGKNVKIGDIFLMQEAAGSLVLMGNDIKVNYSGLVNNSYVQDKIKDIAGNMVSGVSKISWLKQAAQDSAGFAAKAAVQIAPGKVEEIGISLLEKPENKKKLMAQAAQILMEKGVCLTLDDCFFVQEPDMETWSAEEHNKDRTVFSEELEEAIIDAVVGYLKVLIKDADGGSAYA